MRQNHNVQVGQVWRSSDPRRLRAIRVESVHAEPRDYPQEAVVTVLYPRPAGSALQTVPFRAFLTTGTKGLVRVS